MNMVALEYENQIRYTVNLGVLPQHRNRCKFLQLCGHRFSVYLHSFWC